MPASARVIIIEDDDSLRPAVVGLVRSLGYSASGFASAEEFIEGQDSEQVDCVISDIQLPGMNGFRLTKLLRAQGNKVPVILITARSEEELNAQALASGALCLLRKPFESGALVELLEEALDRRKD